MSKSIICYVLAIITTEGKPKYYTANGLSYNLPSATTFKTRKQAQKEAAKHETKYYAYPVRDYGNGLMLHI